MSESQSPRAPRVIDARERQALQVVMGRRVQAAIAELGFSQRSLARHLGMSASWVREVVAGRQWAPPYLLIALAEATERPVGWFYGGTCQREHEAESMLQDVLGQHPDCARCRTSLALLFGSTRRSHG